jgi:cephalosporin hydroxylase
MHKILKEFFLNQRKRVLSQFKDKSYKKITHEWTKQSLKNGYIYNFTWQGIPIIKFPSDLIVFQEIINNVKPDLIIETGVAHGGSLVFYSSIQRMYNKKARTIGVEIDFRGHNKDNCKELFKEYKIQVIEKSSTSEEAIKILKNKVSKFKKVLVFLDSDHSHNHVLKELELYSQFVSKGSYLICTDTVIDFMPKGFFLKDWQKGRNVNRNFDKGDSPYTALKKFMKNNDKFVIDDYYHGKSMVTENPYGFLKKIKN